ncbi:DUF4388 domain-containing protein [bacterium]|nr:DUF4388 domain-containing protein [candidate division CSSED10-310 bacterium]
MGGYDLKGVLRVIGLAELVNLLQSSAKSGFLDIRSGASRSRLGFRRGEIAIIHTMNTNWNLLKMVHNRGLLSPDELKEAEVLCDDVERYAGIALLQHGMLDPGTVMELTKELIPQEMADLLKLRDGEFQFVESDVADFMPLPVSMSVPFVMLHAVQLLDEIQRNELSAAEERGLDIKPRVGKLIQVRDGRVLENHTLRLGSNTIGTDSTVEIRLPDEPGVNPRHARIYLTGLNYFLDSLAGATAVRVNGLPAEKQQLYDGDEIAVGSYRFLFHRMLLDRRTGVALR